MPLDTKVSTDPDPSWHHGNELHVAETLLSGAYCVASSGNVSFVVTRVLKTKVEVVIEMEAGGRVPHTASNSAENIR